MELSSDIEIHECVEVSSKDYETETERNLSSNKVFSVLGDTRSTTPKLATPPKDRFYLIWLIFFLNSGGFWLAWNLMNFIGPTYYFDYWFSTIIHIPTKYATDFLNALGMLACSPLFAMGYIALIPYPKINIIYKYLAALIVYLLCVMALLIATCTWKATEKDRSSFFTFSVTIILIMMGTVGLFQSFLYGMAADFRRSYTSAIVIGTNFGGILASLCYIAWIGTPRSRPSEIIQAKAYYSVALGYTLLCIASVVIFWISSYYKVFARIGEEEREAATYEPVYFKNGGIARRIWNGFARFWYQPFFRDFGEVFCTAWSELLGIFMIFFTMYAIFPTLSVGIQPHNTPGMSKLPKYYLQIGTFLNFYTLSTIGAIIASFINFPTNSKRLRIYLLIPCYLSMYLIIFFMFCNFYPSDTSKQRTAKVVFKNEWFYYIANGFLGLLVGFLSGILMPLASRVVRPQLRRLAGQMALTSLLTGLYLGAGMTPGFILALTVKKDN